MSKVKHELTLKILDSQDWLMRVDDYLKMDKIITEYLRGLEEKVYKHKDNEMTVQQLDEIFGFENKPAPQPSGKWCEHIRFDGIDNGVEHWTYRFTAGTIPGTPADTWSVCPVERCQAKRPAPRPVKKRLADIIRDVYCSTKVGDAVYAKQANASLAWFREKVESQRYACTCTVKRLPLCTSCKKNECLDALLTSLSEEAG